jgi:hypothetical protein
MFKRFVTRFKPGVPQRIHLLLAALLWSCIGITLFIRGLSWTIATGKLWIVIPALMIGTIKSLFILDKTANNGIQRILKFTDGTCLGAVYSLKTWLLIILMMGTGIIVRHSSIPQELLGGAYMAIGWALCFSSRHAWRAWQLVTKGF